MWVCMWPRGDRGGGGVLNVTLEKKHREQIYAISNQHWVCKFEEMGLDIVSKKKKNREIIVLRGGGEGEGLQLY